MTLTYRAATAADIPLLRELAEQIWRASYAEMIGPDQIDYMLGWMYSAEKIAEELASGVRWQIAELDGVPIGYLALEIGPSGTAELHKLYLLSDYQGRGWGQAMLAHVLSTASALGCSALRLRVNKANTRALRAYARAGFHLVDSRITDIGGGFAMDDFVLTHPLAGHRNVT